MIRMKDFSYDLKESSIARYPADPRGSSKLVRVNGGGEVIWLDHFANHFPSLGKGCHLVLNDSRVLDARLFVTIPGNDNSTTPQKPIELMILDLGTIDLDAPCQDSTLRAMIRTDQLHPKQEVIVHNSTISIQIETVLGIWEEDEQSDGNGLDCLVRIQTSTSIQDFLNQSGSVPIPPYFQRPAEASDKQAYNNVYAKAGGSVAAPTAGLHFTRPVLSHFANDLSFLTLHVGAGTFQPVLKENAAEHDMHAETFAVPLEELERIIRATKPLVVVGTTSCRTLESLYWCGVKQILEPKNEIGAFDLGQFEWKVLASKAETVSYQQAFQSLVDASPNGNAIMGRTRMMIAPGYQFRVVQHLVTNFHAPDSTLMLLVSAFLGDADTIRQIYHQAQEKGYRFLSYGDVCMFSRKGCSLPADDTLTTA